MVKKSIYVAITVALLTLIFASSLMILSQFMKVPLNSGDSGSYSFLQNTLGLAITSVAAVVALLLAIKSLQGSEKEITAGIIGLHDPEVTKLINDANEAQDLLRDFIEACIDTKNAGRILQHSIIRVARTKILSNDFEPSSYLNNEIFEVENIGLEWDTLNEDLEAKIRIFCNESVRQFDEILHIASIKVYGEDHTSFKPNSGWGIYDIDQYIKVGANVMVNEQSKLKIDFDANMLEFQKSNKLCQQKLRLFTEVLSNRHSGIFQRVLSNSFEDVFGGKYHNLDKEILKSNIEFENCIIGNHTYFPKINFERDRYLAIQDLPDLFEDLQPTGLVEIRNMTLSITDYKLTKEHLKRRIYRGMPLKYRGPKSPENLGEHLGSYLPVSSEYHTGSFEGLEWWRPFNTFDGLAQAYSLLEFEKREHNSKIFENIIPLLIRLISPDNFSEALSRELVDYGLDANIVKKYVQVKLGGLYSYEVFGEITGT